MKRKDKSQNFISFLPSRYSCARVVLTLLCSSVLFLGVAPFNTLWAYASDFSDSDGSGGELAGSGDSPGADTPATVKPEPDPVASEPVVSSTMSEELSSEGSGVNDSSGGSLETLSDSGADASKTVDEPGSDVGKNDGVSGTDVSGESSGSSEPAPKKTDVGEDTLKSTLTIVSEDKQSLKEDLVERDVAPKEELVDAPSISPEGSEDEYNIFGVAGAYYVSVPKSMSFTKLANGNFESSRESYYTVNSVMDDSHQLSVKVSGNNVDDTVELKNISEKVYRKVDVSTAACDVWEFRPDGTRLTVKDADESGYGSELILEGPGRFKAKCRLTKFGDDEINAGTWTGSILFTVTCSPEPEVNAESTTNNSAVTASESGNSAPAADTAAPPVPTETAAPAPADTPAAAAPPEALPVSDSGVPEAPADTASPDAEGVSEQSGENSPKEAAGSAEKEDEDDYYIVYDDEDDDDW